MHWNFRIALVHWFNSNRDLKVAACESGYPVDELVPYCIKRMQGPHGAASGQSVNMQTESTVKYPGFLNSNFQDCLVYGAHPRHRSPRANISETWKGQPCTWEIANNCTEHPVTKSRSLMSSASIWETLRGEERGSCGGEQKNLGLCGQEKFYMWGNMFSITLWSLFSQKIMPCLFENNCKLWNYFLLVHRLRNNLACW